MSRKILCGPSWRPILTSTDEEGTRIYRIGTGKIDNIEPDNHAGTDSPLEISVLNILPQPIRVWLEVTLQLGGDYGMTATSCTLKASDDPWGNGWADYPVQWNPETELVGRIVLCHFGPYGMKTRIVGRNLLTFAPITSGCNAMYKVWGDAEGIDSIDNFFITQRGVFFCYADKTDPTKPEGIEDIDEIMFT